MRCREASEKRRMLSGRRILSFLLVLILVIAPCSTVVLAEDTGGDTGDGQTATPSPTPAPVPSPSESFYVYDGANVLGAETESAIVEKCKALDESCGAQIVVMTMALMPGTGADARKAYAAEVVKTWGIGGESGNGLLLVLSIADDDYWVAPTEQFQESFTLSVLKNLMSEYLETDFKNKAYDDGVTKFVTAAAEKAETYVRVQQMAAGAGSADPESGKAQDGAKENVFLSVLKGIGIFILMVVVLLAVLLVVVYIHGQQVRKKRREARRRRAQARGGSAASAGSSARTGSRNASDTHSAADNSDYRAFMERYK